jgi:hypothetical protein
VSVAVRAWGIAALVLGVACEPPKDVITGGGQMGEEKPAAQEEPQEKGGEGTWHPGKPEGWTTEGPPKEPQRPEQPPAPSPGPSGTSDTWHPGKPAGWTTEGPPKLPTSTEEP